MKWDFIHACCSSVYVSEIFFYEHVLLFSVPITFFGRLYLFVCVCIYSFILYRVRALYIDECTKCFGGGPAESGYPCGAWLGCHSEIDVILITLEVAYHKGPGPVRPFVLCTRRCYTHTHTHVPCFPLIDSLSLSLSFTPSVSECASPLEMPKTMRRVGGCVCIIYFVYIVYCWIT